MYAKYMHNIHIWKSHNETQCIVQWIYANHFILLFIFILFFWDWFLCANHFKSRKKWTFFFSGRVSCILVWPRTHYVARIALDIWSTCLCFSRTRITGVEHHTKSKCIWHLDKNSGLVHARPARVAASIRLLNLLNLLKSNLLDFIRRWRFSWERPRWIEFTHYINFSQLIPGSLLGSHTQHPIVYLKQNFNISSGWPGTSCPPASASWMLGGSCLCITRQPALFSK